MSLLCSNLLKGLHFTQSKNQRLHNVYKVQHHLDPVTSPVFSFALTTPAILALLLYLWHARYAPTSGPLCWLCPVPECISCCHQHGSFLHLFQVFAQISSSQWGASWPPYLILHPATLAYPWLFHSLYPALLFPHNTIDFQKKNVACLGIIYCFWFVFLY